ncbi:Immunoglobulin superfamily member 10 [Schistosoma japonicum]|uniref:Immunoglobulin superfamily member 10 n=1 Tax=Schistosoma japonicum TaxID=6182 RepID=A0A4Z2DPS5_SCHJA|nr:Immunoglobulin superfamily member 10 [Schistosoma japonicum]
MGIDNAGFSPRCDFRRKSSRRCSIFYQKDFKWKKALCDSEVNKLHEIPLNLPINLIELRVLYQSIEILQSNSLKQLIHLETLQIESCQLKQIESNAFHQLISLKHLNLRNNSLKFNSFSFPVDLLRNLPNLLSLNLAENPIDLIPDAFFTYLYQYKLQYLWLNSVKSNGIIFESNTMKSLKYLRLLDLSYTGLYTLHRSNELILSSMLYLNEFYLHGNPWLCDCQIKFHVSILNTDGNILYPDNNQSFLYKIFHLLGINNDLMNWIYAGIAMISLFIMLALIGIGIFCCCEQPHSRSDHYQINKKVKNNKDDSVSSLLVTINDEQKIIDKNELQLVNNVEEDTICVHSNVNTFRSSTVLSTTTTCVSSNVNIETIDSNTSIKNIDENRLLNIFCCPTNATRDVQMLTIPTINSPSSTSSTNLTHLGESLIHETVNNEKNRVLVSCDSPEPKLLIANGVTPCSNISSINFSTCLQQQSLNITPQLSSTSWDTNGVNPISEFTATNTSSNQIIIETSKPCPVHGIMKLKQMNTNNHINTSINITTTDSNYISSIKQSMPNYKNIDSVYWDHFNNTAVLTSPHFSNYVLLNSQGYGNNNNNTTINSSTDKNVMEVYQNYSKTASSLHNDVYDFSLLQKANLNEMNIQSPIDSLLSGSCPVHGNQTLTRTNDRLKQNDKADLVLGNHRSLKRHHFSKSVICDQSDEQLNQHYHGILDNQEVSVYSSTDTNENEETDNQSNYVHNGHHGLLLNSMKPEQVIYTSTDETESQSESSLSEKSLHSDCASTSCRSSTSSTTASVSSINRQFCPSPELLNNHRPRSSNSNSFKQSYINNPITNSKCPLHSLSMNRRSLSDKFHKHHNKLILRPGSKHKLDTETDSDDDDNNTSEENNFQI